MYLSHHQQLVKVLKDRFGDKVIIGLEVGTFCGDSATAILNQIPNCKMLCTIDPWEHRDGAEFEAGELQPYHDKNRALAESRLAQFGERIRVMPVHSTEAVRILLEEMPGIKFDFVWIDGDHSEQGITTDLELFDGMIKEGGLIGGHDYGQCHPLTEIILKKYDKELNSGNDYAWWVYK